MVIFNVVLIKRIICGILGGVIGFCIPAVTRTLIQYKNGKRGIGSQPIVISGPIRIAIMVFMFISSMFLAAIMPVFQEMFAILFLTISVILILTDYYIRLIPNECVLLFLISGIGFRLYTEGIPGILNSLIAEGLIILFFGISAGAFYIIKKQSGIGAGDLKLAMAIAWIVGYPDIFVFFFGMAAAILVYLLFLTRMMRFSMNNYFPMAAHLCVGFWIALLIPYITESGLIF